MRAALPSSGRPDSLARHVPTLSRSTLHALTIERRTLAVGVTNQARAVCLMAIGRTSAADQKRP